MSAYVMINTEPGSELNVQKKLGEIESVNDVYITYGIYHIIATVNGKNMEDMKKIKEDIRHIDGVKQILYLLKKTE
ncbi:MAG: Lrp/AsnC ligand binding domain-containing protein [Candidatus Aenigmatarchaeota archaeon]